MKSIQGSTNNSVTYCGAIPYFVISGLRQRTYLFERTRGFLFSARITDWLTWIGGGLVFLLALWLLGSLWYWLGFAILAVGLAAAYSFVVDDGLARQRKEPLEKMEQLLKSLRLKGVDETSLRSFVARYSGDNWEEFFEVLFNYEAKLAARERFGRAIPDALAKNSAVGGMASSAGWTIACEPTRSVRSGSTCKKWRRKICRLKGWM